MIYRALDENGDMTFGKGPANLKKDADAVRQAVITRLKLLQGEWWENYEDGLPLFQKILAKRDITEAKRLIRERIAGTEGVLSVNSFNASFENRKLEITGSITTIFGNIAIQEVLA